jgi:hypothetical protein
MLCRETVPFKRKYEKKLRNVEIRTQLRIYELLKTELINFFQLSFNCYGIILGSPREHYK